MNKSNLKYFLIIFLISSTILKAQFYFFGRNKVQYEDFDWKVLKTEHFNIYYYGEFEEIASIGAKYAEDAYNEHKVKFNNVVTRRIPLIFYNTHTHFQQTNTTAGFIPEGVGGFFEFIKGRVVIPFFGDLRKFKHVIRHELVHVFMMNKVYNVLRERRFQTTKVPHLWFIEGIAEYWSEGEPDTQGEMVLRDAIINNVFIPLEQLYLLGGYLMYKEGQSFLQFVSEEYGEERILLFLENIWRFRDFYDVIEFTLGEKIETVGEKWKHKLRQKYFPLLQNKDPYTIVSNKLTESGFNFSPRYYKNGDQKEVYYLANVSGYTSLYKFLINGKNERITSPEVLLQGEKEEAYETFHLLENSIDVFDDKIIFVSKAGKTDAIHVYSIEEEKVIKSYQWDELITVEGTKYSYDGNKIVFSAVDWKGYSDLYVLDVNNDQLSRITNDYYEDKTPIFTEDNKHIVFSSDRTEGVNKKIYNLFKVGINNLNIEYITYSDSDIDNPRYSPDFSELYFSSNKDGTFNIWKLSERDENIGMEQVTKFVTSYLDYSFIDNENLLVSGFEKFSFHLYSLNKNDIVDTTDTFHAFEFDNTGERWFEPTLDIDPDVDIVNYEKEYNLDYAVSQLATDPVYGPRGGALLSISDLLSDDKYFFLLYNTAETQSEFLKSMNVAITRLNQKYRTNYAYGVFHLTGRRYDIRDSDDFFEERSYGGFFNVIHPFSKFRRLEASITVANTDKKRDTEIIPIKSLLISNNISYIQDNSIWGSTGPIDGSRLRLLLGYTSDIKYSNVNYYSFIADYRKYFRLGQRFTLATRAAIFVNHGKEARRYIAGGSWDLRGWNRWSIRGEKLWLSSIEFRYPFIDQLYIRFPFFGLGFTSIRGAIYFDAGGAWDKDYEETIGSIGTGIRINFLNAITFRYDIGKKIEKDFKQLQPKLYYQFFFGWDF